jgi:hypothetical protein
MDHDDLEALRRESRAWRLLRADHAPLVLSFLGRVYVDENARSLRFAELVDRLDDTLYALNERLGAEAFPRPAKAYVDDWASAESGWLRKYYPPGSEEPHVEATPALEKAVAFVRSLPRRAFVGTESRLTTAVELLRQIAHGAETDRDVRLAELLRRRAELDAEIAALQRGELSLMDGAAVRDRFQQFVDTAFGLLSDMREVEDNLRGLDRSLREKVAGWDGGKGELLDEVLGDRDAISSSDQGRSFHAFYDFLLSRNRQEELAELLRRVCALETVGEVDPRVRVVHHDWLDAGERTQATVRLLSDQLRRFLDDRAWLENRRVMDVLRSIEVSALAVRDAAAGAPGGELDESAPTVALPFERHLYVPKPPLRLDSSLPETAGDEVDVGALFAQSHVDTARLAAEVRRALQGSAQAGLADVLARAPLQQGLAELLGYFALDEQAVELVFDPGVRERLTWTEPDGRTRAADVPRLTFRRRTPVGLGAVPAP